MPNDGADGHRYDSIDYDFYRSEAVRLRRAALSAYGNCAAAYVKRVIGLLLCKNRTKSTAPGSESRVIAPRIESDTSEY